VPAEEFDHWRYLDQVSAVKLVAGANAVEETLNDVQRYTLTFFRANGSPVQVQPHHWAIGLTPVIAGGLGAMPEVFQNE
jgi:hypothetical protein